MYLVWRKMFFRKISGYLNYFVVFRLARITIIPRAFRYNLAKINDTKANTLPFNTDPRPDPSIDPDSELDP